MAEKIPNQELLPPGQIAAVNLTPQQKGKLGVSCLVITSLFWWSLSQFFQGRGVTLIATRIFLAVACACTIVVWCGCAKVFGYQRSVVWLGCLLLVCGAIALDRFYPMPPTSVILKKINDKHRDEFEKEFTLGYKLFGISNKQFFPFQGEPTETAFLIHWEKQNYSWRSTDDTLALHLPDIDFVSNFMLHDITVSLPNEIGSSLTFRVDPKSFRNGAAIVSNEFDRTKEHPNAMPCSTASGGNAQSGFPGSSQILTIMQAKINWGFGDYYQIGQMQMVGNAVQITGGELCTSRTDIFSDTTLIRGNTFVGGPRGGYSLPKAGTIVGNIFSESLFDASRLPDGAIVAYNRFISSSGVYRIGPQPDISFVVKIVQTEKDGAVLLFGAKPYKDDEGQ
jgi:hypothetical protein